MKEKLLELVKFYEDYRSCITKYSEEKDIHIEELLETLHSLNKNFRQKLNLGFGYCRNSNESCQYSRFINALYKKLNKFLNIENDYFNFRKIEILYPEDFFNSRLDSELHLIIEKEKNNTEILHDSLVYQIETDINFITYLLSNNID